MGPSIDAPSDRDSVSFRPLPDREVQRLSEDELIAYIREGRAAGELLAARRALAFLVYGNAPDIKRRLMMKVPERAVEDLAHDALVKAIAAAFHGGSEGEFRSWLHTIVDRTAVDYYRRAQRRPKEAALPSEHADDDDVWADEPYIESQAGEVELRIIVDELIGAFNEKHRQVIDLHVFLGLSATQVSERIDGMSEDNVAQVASRFRAKLREMLGKRSTQ